MRTRPKQSEQPQQSEQPKGETERESVAEDGGTVNRGYDQRQQTNDWFVSETVDSFVPPALAVLSVSLTWINLTAMGMTRTWSGFELDSGKMVLAIGLVLIAIIFVDGPSGNGAGVSRYLGGAAIVGLGFFQMTLNEDARQKAAEEVSSGSGISQEVAQTVSLEVGIGMWLAMGAGLLMVLVEYNHRNE